MKLKPLPKFLLILTGVGTLFFGAKYAIDTGMIKPPVEQGASVIPKTNLPAISAPTQATHPQGSATIPKTTIAATAAGGKKGVRLETIPWNATMGLHYANGGAVTVPGGLMANHGVSLTIARQDDYAQMQSDLVAFAQALANGDPNPSAGAHFVVIMGNGAPHFLGGLNQQLIRLDPQYTVIMSQYSAGSQRNSALAKLAQATEYKAEIIAGIGYSRGEDKCMGTPEMATDPQKMRGALGAGVKLDGDQDVCFAHAANNDVPFNADETTYDLDKLNWLSTPSFGDADQKFISGYCETRAEVHDGNRTGKQMQVCVNIVATWTPGDVAVAKEKGGLVSLASTGDKDYIWQMPATIIGIQKWNIDNRPLVENMLLAILEGGEAVQTIPGALEKAAAVSAEVYKEEDATYWAKYYRGVIENDRQGLSLQLGGSYANNLADAMHLFGLLPGTDNLMELVYTSRGEVGTAIYPDVMPGFPPAREVINTTYVAAIAKRAPVTETPAVPTYESGVRITQVTAQKSWHITFQSGKATFTPEALALLAQIRAGTEIGGQLMEIHGHTDSTGNPAKNQALSLQRAEAVKRWLMQQSPVNYPDKRIHTIPHGDTQPVADNSSETGRAQNRRVDIVLGK